MAKNSKLQKIKSDVEKGSHELDNMDPKNWTFSDRQHLTQNWMDLQRKFDDQCIEFIYKPATNSTNESNFGELHLKTPNQSSENTQLHRLQRQHIALIDPFDNQDGIYRSNPVKITLQQLLFYFSFLVNQWT